MTPHDYVIAYLVAGIVYVGLICRSAWDQTVAEFGADRPRRYFVIAAISVVFLWPLAIAKDARDRIR